MIRLITQRNVDRISGRLPSQVQGLTVERVSQIKNGLAQADVEALIGPSYYSIRYPFKREELVHIYRFQNGPVAACFYVGYNAAAVVTSTGMGDENRERGRVWLNASLLKDLIKRCQCWQRARSGRK